MFFNEHLFSNIDVDTAEKEPRQGSKNGDHLKDLVGDSLTTPSNSGTSAAAAGIQVKPLARRPFVNSARVCHSPPASSSRLVCGNQAQCAMSRVACGRDVVHFHVSGD